MAAKRNNTVAQEGFSIAASRDKGWPRRRSLKYFGIGTLPHGCIEHIVTASRVGFDCTVAWNNARR